MNIYYIYNFINWFKIHSTDIYKRDSQRGYCFSQAQTALVLTLSPAPGTEWKAGEHKIVFGTEDWVLPSLHNLQVPSLCKTGLTWDRHYPPNRNLLWWISSYSEATGPLGGSGGWDCAGATVTGVTQPWTPLSTALREAKLRGPCGLCSLRAAALGDSQGLQLLGAGCSGLLGCCEGGGGQEGSRSFITRPSLR